LQILIRYDIVCTGSKIILGDKEMNENENQPQDAEVVGRPVTHKDTVALEALRTQITSNRDDFKKQVTQVKEAIETREAELKNLNIKLQKLQGAIESAELLLKPTPATK
jgi:chromosome segregation ATPase